MNGEIKVIIFDWGRTLHNSEADTLFVGVHDLIKELSTRYSLALVSLAKSDTPESRKQKIEESALQNILS